MIPVVHSARELLELELPKRNFLLSPWLPEASLSMIYAARGVGKSHLALGIAGAVSGGSDFLGWTCPAPRRVLFVDGEMNRAQLQERVAALFATSPPDNLSFLAADLQAEDLPCLSTPGGQSVFRTASKDADLIVLDNLATLIRSGDESDVELWKKVQAFLISLRREGKAVLIVHHAGKSGDQRGSSAREDVLETVIKLSPPDDHLPEQGAQFELHFTKNRGFFGQDAAPFEAIFEGGSWKRGPLRASADLARMQALKAEGLSQRAIGEALGVSHATVSRQLRAADQRTPQGGQPGADDGVVHGTSP
ncbi:AAA family ATPase [uncultured Brevundimonas sp.]|uniref:AAA family ATPase n=1 Tax=uncultured Brevundimonas sp. TaxID=213418 RepID=UPI00259285CC|nr:AAA family ATPase [uncultured Brevundimonas sp.]